MPPPMASHSQSTVAATISIDRLRRWSLSRAKLMMFAAVLGGCGGILLAYVTDGRDVPVNLLAPWILLMAGGAYSLWSARRGLFPRSGLVDVPRMQRKVDHYGLPFVEIRDAVLANSKSAASHADGARRERDRRLEAAALMRRRARRSLVFAGLAASWFCIPATLALLQWAQPGGIGDTVNDALKQAMQIAAERYGVVGDVLAPLSMLLVLLLLPLGVAVWHWANVKGFVRAAMALEQPDAAIARALDPRPPTLFLRSFLDDALELPSLQSLRGLGHDKVIRFEEAFANLFSDLGPMIAIGEPGENLPNVGAAKSYFSDDEWQSAVLSWMDEALLVALAVGPTPAVTWELQNALQRGHLGKLILILPPPRARDWWEFWRWGEARADRTVRVGRLLDCFAGTPWAAQVTDANWTSAIVAYVADNRLMVITAKRPVDVHYQIALVIAFYGLLYRNDAARVRAP